MKRIIICADGTWNNRDQLNAASGKRRPTNVTKLARAVLPRAPDGTDQVVYYHDGIGNGGPLDRLTGGAFGAGMEANIRALYRFIAYNHAPGDELYFFGFSRGAFTVRSLAGFMQRLGLVEKDDDYYVPELYACYERNAGPGTPEWDLAFHKVKGHRPCPPIRMVGVWDTVGALGAPGLLGQLVNRGRYQYHDVGLNDCIEHAVHAMAIDEHRQPFDATLWVRPPGWKGHLVQAWFAGAHSNVGGGCKPDGLANEALHWVAEQAENLGLALDSAYLAKFEPHFDSVHHDSMSTMMYRLMGPHERPIGNHLADGEVVHRSAMDRWDRPECHYRPANLGRYLQGDAALYPPAADTHRVTRGQPAPLPPDAQVKA